MNKIYLIVWILLFASPLFAQSTEGVEWEWAIPPQFDDANNFCEDLALIEKDGKWGFINKKGKIIIQSQDFQDYVPSDFHEGLVSLYHKRQYDVVFIDKKGKLVKIAIDNGNNPLLKPNILSGFNGGLHRISLSINQFEAKYGYMDKTGKVLIQPQFNKATNFHEDMAYVEKDSIPYFINKNGIVTIKLKNYGYWEEKFSDGLLLIRDDNDKAHPFKYIDSKGNIVLNAPLSGGSYTYGFTEGLASIKVDNKWGWFDKKGSIVIQPQFEATGIFSNGLAGVVKNHKSGYIDKTGQVVILPQFEGSRDFTEGFAAVIENGKWGYIKLKKNVTLSIAKSNVIWKYPIDSKLAVTATEHKINACITGRDKPSVELYVDGALQTKRGLGIGGDTPNNSCENEFSYTLKLQPRSKAYKIEIVATNSAGTTRSERYITVEQPYTPPTPTPTVVTVTPTEKRLALVVGNSTYAAVTDLKKKPLNDADDMAAALKRLGFTVITVKDADKQVLEEKISDFTVKLKDYDVGLFFYAGHGLGVDGKNYIVPVDFPKNATKSDFRYKCIENNWVQEKMAEAGAYSKTNIVIIDACRDDGGLRNLRGGVGASDTWLPPAKIPTGLYTCYAASQGETSANGNGRNGLYTSTLLKHIETPNVLIEQIFKRVRIELVELGGQTPEETSKLTAEFYFKK